MEAIFKVVHSDKQDTLPLFSSLLSFLAHCNEGDNDNTDKILCSLLQSINPADLTEWQLGPLLCGRYIFGIMSWAPGISINRAGYTPTELSVYR